MLLTVILYAFLLILPAAFGAWTRFSLRGARRASWCTGVCVLIAVGAWLAVRFVPSYGSEVGGILRMIFTALAAGMLVMEGYLSVKKLRP